MKDADVQGTLFLMRCFKLASFILEVREQICTQGPRDTMEK
jgi:hypothetical protein